MALKDNNSQCKTEDQCSKIVNTIKTSSMVRTGVTLADKWVAEEAKVEVDNKDSSLKRLKTFLRIQMLLLLI